jgi:hypothetical protein
VPMSLQLAPQGPIKHGPCLAVSCDYLPQSDRTRIFGTSQRSARGGLQSPPTVSLTHAFPNEPCILQTLLRSSVMPVGADVRRCERSAFVCAVVSADGTGAAVGADVAGSTSAAVIADV